VSLNKVKPGSQMYPWCNATWNPIKGYCSHQCVYCYYQSNPRFRESIGPLRLDEKCFKDNLGEGNTIFVGSSTDMWAREISQEWILDVLAYCKKYPDNTYLFQSKDPYQFLQEIFQKRFPPNRIFGTTIESNRYYEISKAPEVEKRATAISLINETLISIEPILDFDLDELLEWMEIIYPSFISIGADSKNHHLHEPPAEKIKELIQELQKFTEVKIKPNLKRLLI